MAKDSKYATISIPRGVADAIDELIEELRYWPSRGSFVREACLDKIRDEQKRLLELRKSRESEKTD